MDWLDAERAYDDEVIGESTLPRLFEDSAERHRDRPAQRYKGGIYDRSLADTALSPARAGEFRAISYGEVRSIVRRLAAGFRELGLESGDRVAIFADTRMEWAQTDFAVLAAGGVVTTVYSGSGPEQVRHLLSDPNASAVVASGDDQIERVIDVEADLDLDFLVSMDDSDIAGDRGDVHTLGEIYERGEESFDRETYESWIDATSPTELASLIYTSGTTGQPKGVRLTHRNFRSNVNQIRKRFGPRPDKPEGMPTIGTDTETVSYLPLAHVFERLAGHFLMFASGACVAYAESPDTLKEDFAAVSPTAATSVPRVYEKIYDTVREQASESDVKRRIFEWATDVGVAHHEAADPGAVLNAKRRLADKLVFSQVREALGGEIEMLISGGGSLSAELCRLYHAMGLPIYEGYGLTETSPVVTVNPVEDPKVGTIGPALPGVEIRIDESAVDPDTFSDPGEVGELLVQGENVTDGYWNDPAATDRAFSDGWFRTGDIVHLRSDGYVEFRERSKQLLVLSTGKNVAPGPIEDAFASSEIVEQCMVVGDGEKFVGALIVPNTDHLRSWADEKGIDLPDDPEAIVADDRVEEYVGREVERVNERFTRHERIKEFRLVPREFTEENEMLTPTMKKKRRVILERFDEKVREIYGE